MSGARDTSGLQRANASPSVATLSRESTARPLDAGMRSTMQSRFGHEFGQVRVHTDAAAARSADAMDARAYAHGSDLVFGPGEYQPHTARGQRLIAHELAHVVQSRQDGSGAGAEERAQAGASQAMQGRAVSASQLGASGGGVHRQPKGDEPKPAEDADSEPLPTFKPFTLPWSLITLALPNFKPPTVPASPAQGQAQGPTSPTFPMPSQQLAALPPSPTFPMPSQQLAAGGGAGGGMVFKPLQLPALPGLGPQAQQGAAGGPLAPYAPPQPNFMQPLPASGGAANASAPDLPSRIGLADSGSFSFGLRFGLPLAAEPVPGTPPERRPQPPFQIPGSGPSALSVSNFQFELLDMSMTGKVPTGLEAVGMGDLLKASFGILSTHIAPELFTSLAQKVSGKPGADYMFDITLTGDFQGGGITFQMPLGKPKPAYKGPSSP